jgi:hypothetical protein
VDTTIDTPRQRVATAFVIAPGAKAAADLDDAVEANEGQPASVAPPRDDESQVDLAAVQALADRARSKQAVMPWFALERAYYRGVEAAAEQVLHPEVASVQSVGWLDRHNLEFISGYVETIALLAPAWARRSDPTRVA